MAVALAALDAVVHVRGPRRRARRSRSPTSTGCPATTPERDTVLEHGELITAVELPPPISRAGRATARCASARRSRSRSSRWPRLLEVEDGRVRDVRLALGGVAHRPWRARRPRTRCAAPTATAEAFARAADAELAAGAPAARQRLQGAARAQPARADAAATWREACDGDRQLSARRRPSTGSRAATRSPARRATPTSTSRTIARPPTRALVQSTVARGAIVSIDAAEALALDGRARGALARERRAAARRRRASWPSCRTTASPTAARSSPPSSPTASRRAPRGARSCASRCDEEAHDVELRADHPRLYKPDKVNAGFETDTEHGDVDAALAAAEVGVDATYTTPADHNNPMEPHATVAVWEADGGLTLYDSKQGVVRDGRHARRAVRARAGTGARDRAARRRRLRLEGHAAAARRRSRRWPRTRVGRPVKLALTRQQMFPLTGYRTPTIQRLRLGADARRPPRGDRARRRRADLDRRRVRRADRGGDADDVRGRRRGAPRTGWCALDVPTPSWMRAPGESPGHVRARVGDGRARRRVRHRPDRAARPQRARHRSRDGAPVLEPQPRRLPARGRATGSAGTTATRSPAPGATGGGWSAPAWPSPPTRRGAARSQATARARGATARSRYASPPPTSAPARAPS